MFTQFLLNILLLGIAVSVAAYILRGVEVKNFVNGLTEKIIILRYS